MTFRFQKRVKLFKGVRLNLSKSGVSTSFGRTGAQLTVGRQTRVTLGIPGSGLSNTTTIGSGGKSRRRSTRTTATSAPGPASRAGTAFVATLLLCWVWNVMTKLDLSLIASVVVSSVVAYLAYKGRSATRQPENDKAPDA